MKSSEARMAEATLLPELEGREDSNYVTLAIQDQRRYFQGADSLSLADPSSSSAGPDTNVDTPPLLEQHGVRDGSRW
jgi:hypothetical protein